MKKYYKNQKDYIMLGAFAILCVLLILMIIFVQKKTMLLKAQLDEMASSQKAEEVAEEELKEEAIPYTKTMRIVIKNPNGEFSRESVGITCEAGFEVARQEKQRQYTGEDLYEIKAEDMGENEKIKITPLGGELHIKGMKNGYPGTFEIYRLKEGAVIVNELDLESYLKRVVPSEMPSSYGAEALKAQAICARTYAYSHSNTYAYPEVEGQMDDTVSFQVYNQGAETKETNQAVEDTVGKVLESNGELIDALYYSTSCGYEQDGSLFGEEVNTKVLPCVYIGEKDPKKDFETYIKEKDEKAYEAEERYFRWQTKLDASKLEDIRYNMVELYGDKTAISSKKKMKNRIFSNEMDAKKALGGIDKIQVLERNPGGAAECIEITFYTGKVKIYNQYNVRKILGALASDITLQNNEVIDATNTLPSANIAIEKQADGNFLLYGGGFGHGVGMSQNGAKNLAAIGFNYKDILTFFYKETELVEIQ